MRLILLVCCLGFLFQNCTDDATDIVISNIDSALQSYFSTFEAEANARGVFLSEEFGRISGRIEQIDEGDVVGECWYNSHAPNEVIIDASYWISASHLGREFVVMHELGHCYLDRDHLDASFLDGTCVSIMHSGLGDCKMIYNIQTRVAYLNELFFGN